MKDLPLASKYPSLEESSFSISLADISPSQIAQVLQLEEKPPKSPQKKPALTADEKFKKLSKKYLANIQKNTNQTTLLKQRRPQYVTHMVDEAFLQDMAHEQAKYEQFQGCRALGISMEELDHEGILNSSNNNKALFKKTKEAIRKKNFRDPQNHMRHNDNKFIQSPQYKRSEPYVDREIDNSKPYNYKNRKINF
ncbi:hypothetical protein SNEBB_002082 [Seison nebaliae]|nr:hypothetical protein SNEBB_002082 [Seison nebaliae]